MTSTRPASTLPARSTLGLVATGSVVLTQTVTIVSAVAGRPLAFLVAAVLGVIADVLANRIVAVRTLLGRGQIGMMARCLVRETGLVVLLARTAEVDARAFLVVALAAYAVPLARGLLLFLLTPLERRVRRPVEIRNIRLHETGHEPQQVPVPRVEGTVLLGLVPLTVGCLGALTGVWWPFVLVSGCYVIVLLAWAGWIVRAIVGSGRGAPREEYLEEVLHSVQLLEPEVILYFSGPKEAVYQVDMWLPVMERIGRRVIVVLRERANLPLVGATTLPIVAIPQSTDLMRFRLPTVRVALYVAHVGKNIHLQREPRMKHVFIGHGESDKAASTNPITKGFDEVWVAGRVSRERWAAARVGVRDDSIVEVGRPQLGGIEEARPRRGRPLSVLYAPTWEGWTNDPAACSVTRMGPALVTWLLARPDTRLVYKPHPLTGTVSAQTRASNAQILKLIRASPRSAVLPVGGPAGHAWDGLEDRDLVVTSETTLYDCFNHADVLIGDISSVLADFIASGKPYAVPNPAAVPHDRLRREAAAARAGYVLDPDRAGWEEALADAAGPDSLARARETLRRDLLGPRWPDPVEPWRHAIADLVDRASSEWPDADREAAGRPE